MTTPVLRRKRRPGTREAAEFRSGQSDSESEPSSTAMTSELARRFYTGRYIVVFRGHSTSEAVFALKRASGLQVASSSDFDRHASIAPGLMGSAVYLESLGVAIAEAPLDQVHQLGISAANRLQIVPERFMFTAGSLRLDRDYLEGYRAGVKAFVDDLLAHGESASRRLPAATLRAAEVDHDSTWGLLKTEVSASRQTGRGIKLAILDTGYDQNHPDLSQRVALSRSFVPGVSVQDVSGHGTHCLGIAGGLHKPISDGPRYGCAGEAELMVGKVLGDDGSGDEGWLLNGLNWALENGADIVSLSIEGPYDPASPVLPQYEAIGTRALDAGRLIIAAAGNYSIRPLLTRPVASPACASTIMSVGAIGPDDRAASFSCVGTSASAVDLSAPGVSIESSYPMPRTRKVESGTSMAAPLVAGIAALHMQATPGLRGKALWDTLVTTARRLPEGPSDIGAGCAVAP
jgi:subtilisin family serine protease